MLELLEYKNEWEPENISEDCYEEYIADELEHMIPGRIVDGIYECIHFIQTTPFIDMVYLQLLEDGTLLDCHRFVLKEEYYIELEDEEFFVEHCLNNPNCVARFELLDEIFAFYSQEYPDWKLQRYYVNGIRVLDHIYNCMKKNTLKEMLYKAGLDELANQIWKNDEVNLLAQKPQDIYEGVSMRSLRCLNSVQGAIMLQQKKHRIFVRELQSKFPDIFEYPLNNAQCLFLMKLMNGDMTVGETGRLFLARRKKLRYIWTDLQYDLYILSENKREKIVEIKKIDPIYKKYLEDDDDFLNRITDVFGQLNRYLLVDRDEYNRLVRVSNRRRDYDWQERHLDYIIRYPQTINDFCRESIYMKNCLITYVDSFVDNDTTIMFMRKADDVNKPFITLEIFQNELMQAYHRYNENCTKEEANWIRDYCKRHGIGLHKFTFCEEDDLLY